MFASEYYVGRYYGVDVNSICMCDVSLFFVSAGSVTLILRAP